MADLKGGTTIGGYTALHQGNIVTQLQSSNLLVTNLNADLWDGYHFPKRDNWPATSGLDLTAGQLCWKNYGTGHTIFDASASTAPNGAATSNADPAGAWSPTYPTLMGWNGSSTYGVRVDIAKKAEYSSGLITWGGQLRNIHMSTADPVLANMAEGDIWIKY